MCTREHQRQSQGKHTLVNKWWTKKVQKGFRALNCQCVYSIRILKPGRTESGYIQWGIYRICSYKISEIYIVVPVACASFVMLVIAVPSSEMIIMLTAYGVRNDKRVNDCRERKKKKNEKFECLQLKMWRKWCENDTLSGIQALGRHCSYHTNWKKNGMYVCVCEYICVCVVVMLMLLLMWLAWITEWDKDAMIPTAESLEKQAAAAGVECQGDGCRPKYSML